MILITLVSCKKETKENSLLEKETIIESKTPVANLKTFVVDDFPIIDEKIKNATSQSEIGKLTANDQVWFKNTNSNQVLIVELHTDYHRLNTLLFYNYNIPDEVLNSINLNNNTGIATLEEKKKHINAFALNATEIEKSFFESTKKIKLGIKKEEALSIYNQPDALVKTKNVEILEWHFYGDKYLTEYPEEIKLNNDKIVAKNSFGHKIQLFFIDDKLIAMNLFNAIP